MVGTGYKISVITLCDFTKEVFNEKYKTTYYYFAIAFANGDSGSIGTKYRQPQSLIVGHEICYILDEKTKKVKIANPKYDKPHPETVVNHNHVSQQPAKPHVNIPHVQNQDKIQAPIQKPQKNSEQFIGFAMSYAKDVTCARIAAQALAKPTTAKTKAKEIDFEADTIKLGKAFYKAIKEMLNE